MFTFIFFALLVLTIISGLVFLAAPLLDPEGGGINPMKSVFGFVTLIGIALTVAAFFLK